jgi:hypothetical protein
VSAWIPQYRRWTTEHLMKGMPLKVYFMNDCPKHWRYRANIELGAKNPSLRLLCHLNFDEYGILKKETLLSQPE